MGKVTTCIDAKTAAEARHAVSAKKIPLRKWIAGDIGTEVLEEWPESFRKVACAWADFPGLHGIRGGHGGDVPKERC